MRLLVVTQYFWPENFRINDLVFELVRRGHEVTVLTGVPNYPDGVIFQNFLENPELFSEYFGVQVVRVPMMARGQNRFQLLLNYLTFALSASVLGPWKLHGKKFDAIFTCQLSPVTVGLPAAVFRKINHAPMILWVLDLWPHTLHALDIVRSPTVLRFIGKLVSFIYRKSDLILAQSKSFIPHIKKLSSPEIPVEYFPNWAESLFFSQSTSPADEVPYRADIFNVMFAGNIGEAQDFPAILDAAESLKDNAKIRWLVVGDGRMATWVQEEIKRRNLHNSVFMLGRYPVERMPSFFTHADALLVTLKDDPVLSMTIPGKLQAYLAAGIPVVAMLNGEGAELVNGANAGRVCAAGDSAGLAASILELSKLTAEEHLIIAKNARELNAREFDRSVLIGKLEAFLQTLVDKNKANETNAK
jgi:colanic acid biosynthesis glycosyl transferase WcaI